MTSFIPLIIITLLFIVQIKMFNSLCKYVAFTYPEEWENLSHNSLGGSASKVNLAESLKTGFFSLLNDERINKFKLVKKFNLYIMGLVAIFSFYLAIQY